VLAQLRANLGAMPALPGRDGEPLAAAAAQKQRDRDANQANADGDRLR